MTDAPRASGVPAGQATFVPAPTCARAARHWVEPLLERWRAQTRRSDVLLVVSELVTNAVLHGAGPVRLRLERHPTFVRVEVSDDGPGRVSPRGLDLEATDGRGLLVVAHLSRDWGVDRRRPAGKTVWAELAVPG